ncbi:MAG: hypothetical protein IV106_07760, partial [Pseudomonas umsongensis]|nr:hypothetical protein [Pseudomonas umsongensis]
MNAVVSEPLTFEKIFRQVSTLDRWVPWHRRLKKPLRDLAPWHFTEPHLLSRYSRWKWDKIPHNGQHGLSTDNPTSWMPLLDAVNTAQEWRGLIGVGFVTTGGVEVNDCTLIGFDFDDVTPDFIPPFKTYAEKSPSGKGVRMFGWAKTKWTKEHQDTLDCKPPHCDHCEVYIGTAPRFLTVTFDKINDYEIAQLTGKDLLAIESWGMHLYEAPKATAPSIDTAGTPLKLSKFKLTTDQKHLVNGTGEIDRSKVTMGLIITLLDGGASQEDILATMVKEPKLWQYCMDHRGDNEDKALQFAKDEINRAYPKSKPGQREALIGYSDKWGEKPVPTPEVDPVTDAAKHIMAAPPFPEELYDNAPGLVGEIARWIMGASHAPRKAFAYATALSVTASLIGPCCTSGGGKLNLYIALVGNTGTGKTEAIKAGLGLLSATDGKDSVHDFPASEAALRRQLGVTP